MASGWCKELEARLGEDRPVVALTGAGVSAESGLATFRGPDGMWEGRDPMSLATPEAFAADPETVWRFYDWRRQQAAAAEPNAAHRALVDWQETCGDLTVITQNVDGLHEAAGSRDVLRLHGSLWILRCTVTGREHEDRRPSLDELPPRSEAGGLLRPGVVWFGESLDPVVLGSAAAAAERAGLLVVAGTSSLVYPAAGLPAVAQRRGAYVVEVNPERTPLSDVADVHLQGSAAEWLPRLAETARERRGPS